MVAKDQDDDQAAATRMDGLAYLGPKSLSALSALTLLPLVSAERVQWEHLCASTPQGVRAQCPARGGF